MDVIYEIFLLFLSFSQLYVAELHFEAVAEDALYWLVPTMLERRVRRPLCHARQVIKVTNCSLVLQ